MAGTTTYYGISYPTSTDYVKDGATAMQTIATGFDSAVAIPTYNNQTGTSYTFVLADTGKTVTSDNASAVTFTIPPQASVAWANNTTLTVRNLGAGVVTIAGGAGVTVTNTAQTVAQYGEVKLIRTASNAWTVVPASGGASGMTFITATSFSGASSANFNNVFSSTYDHYKIILNITDKGGVDAINIRMRNGGTDRTGAEYDYYLVQVNNGPTLYNSGGVNATSAPFAQAYTGLIDGVITVVDIFNPFVSTLETTWLGSALGRYTSSTQISGTNNGMHNSAVQNDGFTLFNTGGQNMSGKITVYGYQKA